MANGKSAKAAISRNDGRQKLFKMIRDNDFFKLLGFIYFDPPKHGCLFLNKATARPLYLTDEEITQRKALFRLAPLEWWQAIYEEALGEPSNTLRGRMREEILCAIYQYRNELGPARTISTCGVGANKEMNQLVWHLGDRTLLADGEIRPTTLEDGYDQECLYTISAGLPYSRPDSQAQVKARALAAAIMRLPWKRRRDGLAFVGWLGFVLASGGIDWRQNLWLVDSSQEGKEYLLNRILKPLLGAGFISFSTDTLRFFEEYRYKEDATPMALDLKAGSKTTVEAVAAMVVNRTNHKGYPKPWFDESTLGSTIPRATLLIASNKMPQRSGRTDERMFFISLDCKKMTTEQWGSLDDGMLAVTGVKAMTDVRNYLIASSFEMKDKPDQLFHKIQEKYESRPVWMYYSVAAFAYGLQVMTGKTVTDENLEEMLWDNSSDLG